MLAESVDDQLLGKSPVLVDVTPRSGRPQQTRSPADFENHSARAGLGKRPF